ncbi:hypothetical protein F2Q69_00056433 [Brassica cretica]|uniref:Uncharacterized protein n=1 Tax=Brassica cretica TaxID=69181 RepID=A0A8S9N0U9_BRACR|nr:hypothetical protein F2Q69_00056433 [Brassica cretica]
MLDSSPMRNTCFTTPPPFTASRFFAGATDVSQWYHRKRNSAPRTHRPSRDLLHLPENQGATKLRPQTHQTLKEADQPEQPRRNQKPTKTVLSEPPLPGSESRRIWCWRSHRSSETKAGDDDIEKSPLPRNQPDRNGVRRTPPKVHLVLPLCQIEKRGQS